MAPTDNYILGQIRGNVRDRNCAFESYCSNGPDFRTLTGPPAAAGGAPTWINAPDEITARTWFNTILAHRDPANPNQLSPIQQEIVCAYRPAFCQNSQDSYRSRLGLFVTGLGAAVALGAFSFFNLLPSVSDNTRFVQDRKIEIVEENNRYKNWTGRDKPGIEERLDSAAQEAGDSRRTFKDLMILGGLLTAIGGAAYLGLRRRNP